MISTAPEPIPAVIEVGAKIVVRHGTGFLKVRVTDVRADSLLWSMRPTPVIRSNIDGQVSFAQEGIEWTRGWNRESFDFLRCVDVMSRRR